MGHHHKQFYIFIDFGNKERKKERKKDQCNIEAIIHTGRYSNSVRYSNNFLVFQLRLGAEARYYPAPLWSTRQRVTVYKEIGNTIMKLLSVS